MLNDELNFHSICSADESMSELLQARYTDYNNEDGDYPDVSYIVQAQEFPRPKQTISSEAIVLARKKEQEKVR